MLKSKGVSGIGEPGAKHGLGAKALGRTREGDGITGRDEQPGLTVANQLG
jgi:hypothetical protein